MEVLKKVIQEGVTAFHGAAYVKQQLLQCGFRELQYAEGWQIEQNRGYVIMPYPSMLIAVSIGELEESSALRLAAAHTDAPCLKVKSNPELPGKYYARMNVEPYGGLLKSTWFDRPLGIAGKIVFRGLDIFHPQVQYIKSEQGVCIIPSLAPHLAKDNKQQEMDIQQELIPIVGLDMNTEDFLIAYLEEAFDIKREELLDYDLYLYNMDLPEQIGIHGELISAPRIDNLASVAALYEAMEETVSCHHKNIAVAAMFDNEEIGSRSKQGADSMLLQQVLEKMGTALGIGSTVWRDKIAKGFLLSMDGAQGYHPNYSNKSDPTNPVYLGNGLVIKTSASQRYVTDSEASAIVKNLCDYAEVPCQQQVNRSGMPGGQTLGPIISSYLPLLGADIGIPMLAMHSARELAASADYQGLVKLAKVFYQYSA